MRALEATKTMGRGGCLLLTLAALGCGSNDAIIRDDYAGSSASGAGGTGGVGGAGGGGGASTTGPLCAGQCAPLGPAEWQGPALVWMGPPGHAPECPPSAPVAGDLGLADLTAPLTCGACTCDPPQGSCALPTTWTAAAAPCAGDGPGIKHTSFDAPAGWSGACTAKNPVAAAQKCDGLNCVQSLTIAPSTLVEGPCGVSVAAPSRPVTATWGEAARSCHGVTVGGCAGPGELCAPPAEPGYRRCLVRDGEHACPEVYTVAHHFFTGLDDTRACSACGCGAPLGSTCTTLVSAYADGACGSPIASVTVDTTKPACVDILPSGAALGSKLAEEPTYAPGTCQPSGGEAMGAALPANPVTVCCLP